MTFSLSFAKKAQRKPGAFACRLPPGVEMTDDERAACEAQGCTVWTMDELRKLIGMAMRKGYEAGKKSL